MRRVSSIYFIKWAKFSLAEMYDLSRIEPDIQVAVVDLLGDRELQLRHTMWDGIPLAAEDRERVLAHLKTLWGYDVRLDSIEGAEATPRDSATTRPTTGDE